MYDLPLLVVSTRRRRMQSLTLAAAYAGISVSTLSRLERGYGCDVRTLIEVLRWMEME